jgi:hypothetical protein
MLEARHHHRWRNTQHSENFSPIGDRLHGSCSVSPGKRRSHQASGPSAVWSRWLIGPGPNQSNLPERRFGTLERCTLAGPGEANSSNRNSQDREPARTFATEFRNKAKRNRSAETSLFPLHFRNMPDPMFTDLPAMLQSLPLVQHGFIDRPTA